MGLVVKNDNISIGEYKITERKKPCLGVMKDNQLVIYGQFHDEYSAEEFMNILAEFIGAKTNGGIEDVRPD